MRATRWMRVRGPEPPGGSSGRRVLERGGGGAEGAGSARGGPECRAPPAELIHHMDEVNDELIKKISHIKAQPQRHFRVERSQPVGLPLTYESGPEEVRAWLEAKAFSARCARGGRGGARGRGAGRAPLAHAPRAAPPGSWRTWAS